MIKNKKNILLIGGSGYLGSHLRGALSPDFQLFYTSRTKNDNNINLDLLNKETYKNIISQTSYDYIIFLASTLKGLGTTELTEEYLSLDTIGFSGFLQFISENKINTRLIYISSMTVYGIDNTVPVNENGILEPMSTYGLSKFLAENIFSFYCKSNQTKGVILRIPGIYGGNRTSGYIYNTAIKCRKQQSIEINTSSLGYWEAINIDDLCNWIKEFIENYDWNTNIDTFNIGYGTKIDFIECARIIKEMSGSKSDIIINENIGYKDFYLDNTKIKKYVKVKNNYLQSLEQYIKNIGQ